MADFISGEALDDIYMAIEEDLFWEDEGFQSDLNKCVTEIYHVADFQCKECDKVCKSQRGLTRHINAKHGGSDNTTNENTAKNKYERSIDIQKFEELVQNSLCKVKKDLCLPDDILAEYNSCQFTSVDFQQSLSYVQTVVDEFIRNGDGEKFYPLFYICVQKADPLFNGLSKHANLFLGYELANHIVAYVSSGHLLEEENENYCPELSTAGVSTKEKEIICYLGGCVLGSLSRRIRSSKNWNTETNQDNLKLLAAGKTTFDHDDLALVNLHDRGGLWKVRVEVCKIFTIAEVLFKSKCSGFVRTINAQKMVDILVRSPEILANFSTICSDVPDVKKEISMNLLEHWLTFYINLRSFSYANEKIQQYKMEKKKAKSRSLRTDIKQKSSHSDAYEIKKSS